MEVPKSPEEIARHPSYECGHDPCWCHDPERLDRYIEYLDSLEEGGNHDHPTTQVHRDHRRLHQG